MERLERREIGSALDLHVQRSTERTADLDRPAPAWVERIPTNGRAVADVAREIIVMAGWWKPHL